MKPDIVIFYSTDIFKLSLRTTQNQNFEKFLWGSLENFLNLNINIFGLSEHSKTDYDQADFTGNTAVIMGSEEDGIRKKTRESCDSMIKLSNNKNFKSFNVSVATGIILSEIARQRKC